MDNVPVFLVLCVHWSDGKIGAVFYNSDKCLLEFIEDVPEKVPFGHTLNLLKGLEPNLVLIKASKSASDFNHFIKLDKDLKLKSGELFSKRNPVKTYEVKEMPVKCFNLEIAKKRLLATRLPEMPESLEEKQTELYLNSLISLDQINMIKCAGALLVYLDEQSSCVFGQHVLGFESCFSLKDRCLVDQQSLDDLKIFTRDYHPSINKSSYSKEGFSIFSLFNKTKTEVGRRQLKQWFHFPLKCYDALMLVKPNHN